MSNIKRDLVSKKLTYEYLKREYVDNQKSFDEIAKELKTNPNRIRRGAKKLGIPARNKSEAQKAALEAGRTTSPTAGKTLSPETKEKISSRLEANWKNITPEDREKRASAQRERFLSQPADKLKEMRSKAAKAIRAAVDQGSKLERAILIYIRDKGLKAEFHRKNLVANERLEADIYLPDLRVIVELDGINHRENINGRLGKQRFADSQKNGLLMAHDFIIIRVADTAKTNSQAYNRRLWKKIEAILDDIKNIQRPAVLNVEDL